MPIPRAKTNNDSARWRDIKKLKGIRPICAYASVYGLAAQGSIAGQSILTKNAINAEIACKAADFAQMAYIPYNQRTDMKQTWSPAMMASYLKCSSDLRWYSEHPLYSKGLMWLLGREEFVKTDPKKDAFKLTLKDVAVILEEPETKKKKKGLFRKKVVSETVTRQLAFFDASSHIKGWKYELFDGVSGLASRKALEPFGIVAKGKLGVGDIVFVAFRGTQGNPFFKGPSAKWNAHDPSVKDRNLQDKLFSADWWTNLKDTKVELYDMEVAQHFTYKDSYKHLVWGEVHKGFRDVYVSTRNQMLAKLSEMGMPPDTAAKMKNYCPICVTGHSLGGALSTLCATDLYCLGYNVILYNFASPRVGTETFAEWFNTNISIRYSEQLKTLGAWRMNQRFDVVPHVPKIGFKHVMNLWQLSTAKAHDMEEHCEKTYKLSGRSGYKAIKTKDKETVTLDGNGDWLDSNGRKVQTEITVKGHRTGIKAPVNLRAKK